MRPTNNALTKAYRLLLGAANGHVVAVVVVVVLCEATDSSQNIDVRTKLDQFTTIMAD